MICRNTLAFVVLALSSALVARAQGIAAITDGPVQPAYFVPDGGYDFASGGFYDDGCATGSCSMGGCYNDGCASGGCYSDCGACDLGCMDTCDYGEFFFNFDATFVKYHQSGGVKSVGAGEIVSDDDGAEFDFDFTPRYSAGYRGPRNLGIRANYWTFDDSAATLDGSGFVSIEAQSFDLEVFKRTPVGDSCTVEVAAGFRAAKFEQRDDTGLDYEVDGTGLTFALDLSHQFGGGQRLYARGRTSIVMGDTELHDEGDLDDDVGVGIDNTMAQFEIGTGWEGRSRLGRGGTLVYGVGVELQQWLDTVITADSSSEAYLSDAGWGGFTLRCGYEF